ncbi:MAG: FAD/NAD(P)-binding oxidoreductase [Rhizobiales bacterium PAR1]|nr:MAG: FAD/NAD(P)-binding oxidoreductase [Rhizobiales bacterium PAR1]
MALPLVLPFDLVVIGAGPAGGAAALAASEAGLRVVLIDESAAPGGQVYRAMPAGLSHSDGALGPDERAGQALREAIAASSVTWKGGARVWSISGRYRIDTASTAGCESFEAPRLVAATGAHERIVPFPGWTLPGVIGLAGATILMKSQGMVPGRRTLVAGCGPLLAAVAAKIIAGGGEVAAIVDLSSRADWLKALPGLASRPALLKQGINWFLAIGMARVPVLFRHTIVRAEGENAVASVTASPVDGNGRLSGGPERTFEVDSLAVGHGLVPGAEIPRLLRSKLAFSAASGGWIPVRDTFGRCSVEGLYAAGDGAEIAGALPAAITGRLAGLAAARDSGALDSARFEILSEVTLAAFRKTLAFSGAARDLMRPRPAMIEDIAPDTVVCRCEDIRRSEIEAAIAAGASEVNQLKHFSRCGMGPCQGRMCGDTVAGLVALHAGSREAAGYWTGRPPLRPVPLSMLLGEFDYSDIPVPEPAPL